MSISTPPAVPRVRQQAREAIAVMAFSAVVSAALSMVLVLLLTMGRQG